MIQNLSGIENEWPVSSTQPQTHPVLELPAAAPTGLGSVPCRKTNMLYSPTPPFDQLLLRQTFQQRPMRACWLYTQRNDAQPSLWNPMFSRPPFYVVMPGGALAVFQQRSSRVLRW